MKKSTLIVAATLLVFSAQTQANVDPTVDENGKSLSSQAYYPTASLRSRFINFQTSPLGDLVGRYNLAVDFKVASFLTLGPKLTAIEHHMIPSFFTESGYEVGLRATISLSGTALDGGAFLRPALFYGSRRTPLSVNRDLDFRVKYEVNGPIVQLLLGYQWVWQSGFNLDIGAGMETYQERYLRPNASITSKDYIDPTYVASPILEINLGIAI